MPTIREHKRNYGKPDQEFECELLHRDTRTVIIRYVTDRAYRVAGRVIETGSSTLGLYREGETHVFWKMIRPDGSLEGYLVHLCEPVTIGPDFVSYRDLLLDIWQTPPAPPQLLDEDELAEAVAKGLLPAAAAEEVRERARSLIARLATVIEEAEAEFHRRL